ncbi:MAG: CinA family nicotinamide mononucleotide deamidase-related protein [Planctomycetota bacterium]|nr:MAG: CinA family nicotinamide mononucleotide deamidase-related protein [Planctomycetota bacterium]
MVRRAAIVAIGSELLCGDGLDTNSRWLSQRLEGLGLRVVLHLSCPDEVGAILDALRFAAERAQVLLTTGGLGPTRDDLTREAVARWAGVSLQLHEPSLERIRQLFARFGRDMPASNRVQAELPVGARVIDNEVGTASAFSLDHAGTRLYALPGVPREMRWLWENALAGELESADAAPPARRTFRTVGISESALGERLLSVEERPGVEVRYAAEERLGTIRVTLLHEDQDAVQDAWREARDLLGEHVCAVGGDTLAESLAGLLHARGLRVATAESCTGGRAAAALTALPGISRRFLAGFVTYSNRAKVRDLGVSEELLAARGAVCPEVAAAMARGARARAGADLGLGVTGVAGPGGGSSEKPVGLVHMAAAGPGDDDLRLLERRFPGDRDLVQARATAAALDLLRRAAGGGAATG